jgi:type IV secretory pathway TrbL component
MTTNEAWIMLGIAAFLGLGILIWLTVLASAATIIFTDFVMKLPLLLSLLLFILFPPLLIVFLSGYAMIKYGFADKTFKND